ncbi:MAG: amino acid adenylation domain-containing protein [Clostridia bacterium]|nr:amino acid adenylation domain-containing protein [Clostridia bacterium]
MLNEVLKKTIVDFFLERAKEYPDQTAVMDVRGAYTYGQLNWRSALLAGKLLDTCKSLGTDVKAASSEGKSGPRIAVLLPRTREYLVAFLAVIRAGCAVIPLDSDYPKERIQTIQQDADCLLFITTKALSEKTGDTPRLLTDELEDEKDADISLNLSNPDIEGLLIFTSGSTGKPKGVIHRQRIFSCGYALLKGYHPFTENDVIGCMAGFPFIASLQDLCPPLMVGGSVYIFSEKERKNTDLLFEVMRKRHITGMFLPPQLFAVMRELYGRLPLKYVMLSGEKSKVSYPDDGNLIESYGSSETAGVLYHWVGQDDPRLLGKPAGGARVYLLDEDGKVIDQPGEIGELCVVSPWLALGYNGLAKETEDRFIPCPFEPGERMCRSGDYMAWDENGNLLFHGRKDRMVKLRGYRVELGEIENALIQAAEVAEAACIPVKVSGGDKLCCYYTGDENADPAALKALVKKTLPEYMVPDYFVHLDALPRNERNKVNYLALQAMEPPAAGNRITPGSVNATGKKYGAICPRWRNPKKPSIRPAGRFVSASARSR